MSRLVLAVALVLAPALALADLGPMPGEERFKGLVPDDKQHVGMDAGFGRIEEDYFVQLTLKTELNLGPVGLGLQVPLNLRVWDKAPKATGDYYGLIRHEDWQRPSDYIKVIRYLRLGHKRDEFYLRVGELAATLGHGTIMNRYLNNVDVNAFRAGSEFDINTDYGGFETVISDFGTIYDTKNPDSRIFALRTYVRPVALADPSSLANIFALGFSVVTDTNAPLAIAQSDAVVDEFGNQTAPSRPIVEDGRLKVATAKAATVYGFDVEAEVLHSAILDIVPYSDLNFIQGAGSGWHLGVLVTAKMPIGFDLTIPVRLEYRRLKANYLPAYFSTFYEIERYAEIDRANNASTQPDPKATYVRGLSGPGLNGYYGDLAFDFAGIFQVGAVYEDYVTTDPKIGPNIQAFLAVPALETIQFKAFYARTNIQGTNDILKFDERSMAVAQARYEVYTYVYLVGRMSRRWVLATAGPAVGTYKATDDWKFGLEIDVSF